MSFDFLPTADELTHDLTKPTRLARDVAKFKRKVERQKDRERLERMEAERWAEIRKIVYARDGGCCRAFGVRLKLRTDNPLELAETHHIQYRSLGGSDALSNLCLLSREAHELEHLHKLVIEGDGNDVVTFVKRNPETGKVIEQWSSTPRGRL